MKSNMFEQTLSTFCSCWTSNWIVRQVLTRHTSFQVVERDSGPHPWNKYQSKLKQLEQQILQPMMKRQFKKPFEMDAGASVNRTMDSQMGQPAASTTPRQTRRRTN
jgi:hypothetical protein